MVRLKNVKVLLDVIKSYCIPSDRRLLPAWNLDSWHRDQMNQFQILVVV